MGDAINTHDAPIQSTVDERTKHKMEKLAEKYSEILGEIILANKNENLNPLHDSFYSKKIPCVSIEGYITRILKYAQIEYSTLLVAMLYLNKICNKKTYVLGGANIHRMLIACFVLAIKYNEDKSYKNSQYAKIGGVPLLEMNNLEHECFKLIDCSLYVNSREYEQFEEYITGLINVDY